MGVGRAFLLACLATTAVWAQTAEVPQDAGWGRMPGLRKGVDVTLRPVQPSDGPILVYVDHHDGYRLVQPESRKPPAAFLRPANPVDVIDRLDRDTLLLRTSPLGLTVAHLPTGRIAPLDTVCTELVSIAGDQVYYVRDAKQGLHLCRCSAQGRELLSSRRLSRILWEGPTDFLALSAEDAPALVAIQKAGGDREIARLENELDAERVTIAVSPDASLIALGLWRWSGDFLREPTMRVLRSSDGGTVREILRVPSRGSYASSISPELRMGWISGDTLRYSISELTDEADAKIPANLLKEGYYRWQDLNVTTGAVTDQGRYAARGIHHDWPEPESDFSKLGPFTIRADKIYARDGYYLAPRSRWGGYQPTLSYDESWLVFAPREGRLCICDAAGYARELQPTGWQTHWLPPTGIVRRPSRASDVYDDAIMPWQVRWTRYWAPGRASGWLDFEIARAPARAQAPFKAPTRAR